MRAFHHLDRHVHRISNFALLTFLLLLSLLTIILNLFLSLFPISGLSGSARPARSVRLLQHLLGIGKTVDPRGYTLSLIEGKKKLAVRALSSIVEKVTQLLIFTVVPNN